MCQIVVLMIIMDHQTTKHVIQSGLIQHLAFTGSGAGGRRIKSSVGSQFIETGLELGGKDPAYVRANADLDLAISGIMDGVFYNAGQSCCGVERIYVHVKVYDKFINGAINEMQNLKIGNPQSKDISLGPLVSKKSIQFLKKQNNFLIFHLN